MANNNIPITQAGRIFTGGALIQYVNEGGDDGEEEGPSFIVFISGQGLTRSDVLNLTCSLHYARLQKINNCDAKYHLKFEI